MTDISVQKVKIGFEVGENVLEDLSFEVTSGEHVGILGRNGAGKTTLFRILTGELTPDEGAVAVAPGKRVGVLTQIPVYPPEATGEDVLKTAHRRVYALERDMRALEARMAEGTADEAALRQYDAVSAEFMRLEGYELDRLRDIVANGLGIPKSQREQPFRLLSGGEKTRMNLARLILEDTDILLLDEPTNHLDMSAVEWLEDYLSRYKGTVLAISHDRYFLDHAVTRIIEVLDGRAEFYSGSYSFYLEEKRRRYEERLRQYEKQEAKIAQLQRAADDLHLWAFMGADKLHKRAFSIEKRIAKLDTVEKPKTEERLRAKFTETEFRADEVLLARGLTMRYGDRTLFENTDLLVRGGERIALIGDNGTGKTTFLRLVLGEEDPAAGLVRLGPAVKTAYLPQSVTFREENSTVLETMMNEGRCQAQEARDRLGAYLFRGEDVFTPVSQLSGGERSRLKLAIIMRGDVNLLILDEPTNHLDIASREWMEDALSDYHEALLFVSHDRYFIQKFATRIWEVRDGAVRDYPFDYDRYREIRARETAGLAEPVRREKTEKPKEPEPREKKMSPSTRERLIKKLEREIAALEKALGENAKAQEEAASDYEKLMALTGEAERLEAELEEKYALWEEAAG